MTEENPSRSSTWYYRPIPGSKELTTGALHDAPALAALAAAKPGPDGLFPKVKVAGVWLSGVRVESDAVTLPLSIWDRLALAQTPLEQAVYQQLARLAYGQGLNYCWVGKRELMRRCRLSERRLHVALDGLVQKGHLRPLARTNRGTLYRVFLPAEALEGREEPGVRMSGRELAGDAEQEGGGAEPKYITEKEVSTKNVVSSKRVGRRVKPAERAKTPPAQRAAVKTRTRPEPASLSPAPPPPPSTPPLRQRPLESPLNEERFADVSQTSRPAVSLREIAAAFFRASGVKPTAEEQDAAYAELTALLEDGFKREEVLRAAEWYGRRFKHSRRLDRLAYYIHQALAEAE